jgi:Ca2+/H+ antiporter, TMEM165/GDT1 family
MKRQLSMFCHPWIVQRVLVTNMLLLQRLLLILYISIPLLCTIIAASDLAEDWFKKLDSNADGNIDKNEYDNGILQISSFLTNTVSSDQLVHSDLDKSNIALRSLQFIPSLQDVSLEGFWKAFTSSVAMIIATEIGDKTFFIAAVLSMKHDRSAVFAGAITALIIMTILSTGMGLILPKLIPKQYTHILGGVLFLYFGVKLYTESLAMEDGKTSDELDEVEEELLRANSTKKRGDEEDGNRSNKQQSQIPKKFWYQVAVQSLTLTFLAEWGDRSQIATIALAAAKNPIGVTIGGCLGHATCTGLAVIGGRMLAARISEKTVSKWGGITFFIFGIHSIFLEG